MRSFFRRLIFPINWITDMDLEGVHLDIGSGKGLFLTIMSKKTDFSEGTEIRKKYLRNSYPAIVSNPTRQQYDMITIIDVLHHIPDKFRVMRDILDLYKPNVIFIKDMSNQKYFPMLMNRVHDFIFGHGDLITELDEEDLTLFMAFNRYELLETKKIQILWYNHFLHAYKRI